MFTNNWKIVLFIINWIIFLNIRYSQLFAIPSRNAWFQTDSSQHFNPDSLTLNDSIPADSLADSLKTSKKGVLDAPIDYEASDSILFSLDNKKVFLYGDAVITYKDMKIESDFIELDLDKSELLAHGMPDSAGIIAGKPVFTEKSESYDSDEMRYNFKTRKGIIKKVVTKQPDGFLHAETVKKQNNGEIHARSGKYTTCDDPHPHFYLALTKAKDLPDGKIISGPAYLVVGDVPFYFPIIPFGFFPKIDIDKPVSGLIIPTYGEENTRGLYLRNGGYYLAFGEYLDLNLTGDIYSKGTWGVKPVIRYKKRYRFTGNLNFSYYTNVSGDRDIPEAKDANNSRKTSKDFSFVWSHTQDAKANPYSNFSASVNLKSSTYNRNHNYYNSSYLNNTQQSSVRFSKSWPNKPFHFSAYLNHYQNNQNNVMNFTLPNVTFNIDRQYPFRRKNRTGKIKWYENIQLQYSSTLENKLNTTDSLFKHFEFEDKNFGYKHDIPLSTNIKFLQFFNLSPSINYAGRFLDKKLYSKSWEFNEEEDRYDIKEDTIKGLYYAHGYNASVSLSANPTLYGMYTFKKGMKVEAIRHVIDPNISLSLAPDMRDIFKNYPDYYDTIYHPETNAPTYFSIYDPALYDTPTARGKSGRVSFSLRNSLEMKVKTEKDTAQDVKKIKIIDNLNLSTSYDLFAGEYQTKWTPINMSTSNSFFNNKFTIRYTAVADIYAIDSVTKARKWDEFVWENSDKIARLTNAGINFGTTFRSKQGAKTKEEGAEEEGQEAITPDYNDFDAGYVNFDVPWDFTFSYNVTYSKPGITPEIRQTLNFNGSVNLTQKWKIQFRSGFDFDRKKLTYTTVNIYRDLHCFEARFNWVPFGPSRSYGFTIQAKSSVLRDLKWDKPRASAYDIGER